MQSLQQEWGTHTDPAGLVDVAHLDFNSDQPTHAVQFFEDEKYLFVVVANFVATALIRGQPAVVIAEAERARGFLQSLRDVAIDTEQVLSTGQLVLLDARTTLESFLVDGEPQETAFVDTVGRIVERLAARVPGSTVCAYGEMVDILWRDGRQDAAVRLEEMWNRLATRYPIALLCAYDIGGFGNASDGDAFRQICKQHEHVVPTERYTATADRGRLLEITRLQQKAAALEGELARREELETDLRLALYRAEEANRAKREFLGVMSHELRTPLNAISGYADLLRIGIHGQLSDPQRDAVARIRRNGDHLLDLVDQILLCAHAGSGKIEYSVEAVSVGELFRAVDVSIAPLLSGKGMRCDYILPDGGVEVLADRSKLRQVMMNLLANAIKFTEDGSAVQVMCQAGEVSVTMRVQDTGVGIAPDKLHTIFDPFVQADSSPSRKRGGMGLGLAISKTLIEGMGGTLTVESREGEGTTATIVLPRSA